MNTLFKTVTSSAPSSFKRTPDQDILNLKSQHVVEIQTIHITDLELSMHIGVLDKEKNAAQRVIINAEVEVSPNQNWQLDEINSVVSYADIISLIKAESAKGHIELVETFAHQIADACFKHSNDIEAVKVTIDKPDIIKDVKSVGCSIKKVRAA